MSIDFYISHEVDRVFNGETHRVTEMKYRCDCDCFTENPCDSCTDTTMNLANMNAYDLMDWLGLSKEPCGTIKARELAALCRRRLWPERRNEDPEITPEEFAERYGTQDSPRIVFAARDAGYLQNRTEQLLRICMKAIAVRGEEGEVSWA